MTQSQENASSIHLEPITRENWRQAAQVQVAEAQKEFVADPCYYLAMCHYDGIWNPLAICLGDEVIGFMMWASDPSDGSCWLGGISLDVKYQGRGLGRQAVLACIRLLQDAKDCGEIALSYTPHNPAKKLYQALGFEESGEMEGDEVVARLHRSP